MDLVGHVADLVALQQLLGDVVGSAPAIANSVGSMSMCETMPFSTEPALILPGQRTNAGTR